MHITAVNLQKLHQRMHLDTRAVARLLGVRASNVPRWLVKHKCPCAVELASQLLLNEMRGRALRAKLIVTLGPNDVRSFDLEDRVHAEPAPAGGYRFFIDGGQL